MKEIRKKENKKERELERKKGGVTILELIAEKP